METTQTESTLALILADVKKLIKHFKLDRRTKDAVVEAIDNDETADNKGFTQEQKDHLLHMFKSGTRYICTQQQERHIDIKNELAKIRETLAAARATEPQPHEIHHRHTIDIGSRKIFISLIVRGLLILILTCALINQCSVTDKFRDNDLKYRYIQMRGETTPDELQKLHEIFDFNSNRDSIRIIRRQVEKYEQLVQEQAESAALSRFNATQAEHIQTKAEAVKEER